MIETCLQANGAFLEDTKLLVTHSHVVECQQKYELIARDLVGLDLIKHRLSFLQQDQSLLVLFLRDKVDSTLIKLVDDHGNLVFLKVQIFIVVFLERVFNKSRGGCLSLILIRATGGGGSFLLDNADVTDEGSRPRRALAALHLFAGDLGWACANHLRPIHKQHLDYFQRKDAMVIEF